SGRRGIQVSLDWPCTALVRGGPVQPLLLRPVVPIPACRPLGAETGRGSRYAGDCCGEPVMSVIFWTTAAAIVYTYVGYSLVIMLLAQLIRRPIHRAAMEPRVTFLITAYNEAKNIRAKLDQVLSLDYPRDKLGIIVASDGSNDGTDDIVREFADRGVKLVRVE